MIKRNMTALFPTVANVWQRLAGPDENAIGCIMQNQQTQAVQANIYVCNREPARLTDALLIAPSFELLEDIFPGQEEVWVYTDALGAALTFNRKYKS